MVTLVNYIESDKLVKSLFVNISSCTCKFLHMYITKRHKYTMVGVWMGYMHSCDSLQVNRRILLLCQGTVHSDGVHFDTV